MKVRPQDKYTCQNGMSFITLTSFIYERFCPFDARV